MNTLVERITQYLIAGGLFNPEQMEHDKVRNLLMDCRAALRTNDPLAAGAQPAAPATQESQQKGGEEPCPKQQVPMTSANSGSSAAPTSDPEGAAIHTEDDIRLDIMPSVREEMRELRETVDNTKRILADPVAVYINLLRGTIAKPSTENLLNVIGEQKLSEAWHSICRNDPPSPTLEKLAQEIDGLYEAPSKIRLLRRILEREFGVSQSVAEVVKEISEFFVNPALGQFLREKWMKVATQFVESILSRFREHELRELREECERLRNTLTTVKELLPTRERALFRDDNSSTPVGVHTISESKVIRICTAIAAAMQPSEESK